MKDLFVGASGRLNNHGGSRMFTTPHTINVPPEYTVETDVPSVAEFVTCSLDGRLWVYRRSRRYYVAAFRWDENTQRLVFVGTTILSNESFVMRGADWILTDKSLIQSIDDEPYITRTTYTDSSYLDTIKKSYSFFPEIETWQKIQGEQIIRVDNPPSETLQESTQSLVTPLEFHYYSENDIKAFTEFSPKLCYINGQLYGKGKAHIGRAYLLPRTFNEDGEPEDFYLYISPDYLRSYNGSFDDNDGWENLRVAPFTHESVAIFTPQNDDYSICKKATNAQIFTLPNGESLDLSADNGALFFDALTGSNLALNDKSASLLRDGMSFECKGIRQWIAPSGKVDTVSPQLVMSSFDNGTLATHVQSGFHRELLAGKTLPLSTRDYSGKRLSLENLGINSRSALQVNSIAGITVDDSTYKTTYNEAVTIKYITSYAHDLSWPYVLGNVPIFLAQEVIEATVLPYLEGIVSPGTGRSMITESSISSHVKGLQTVLGKYGYGLNSQGENEYPALQHSCSATLFWINPDTGEATDFTINTTFTADIPTREDENGYCGDDSDWEIVMEKMLIYEFASSAAIADVPSSIIIQDGSIGYLYTHYTNGGREAESRFRPLISLTQIPAEILDWRNNSPNGHDGSLLLQAIQIPVNVATYSASAKFREKHSNVHFFCDIPSVLACINGNVSGILASNNKPSFNFFNFWNINSLSSDESFYTHGLHIATSNDEKIIVFRSELHPEIFDFQAEIERSKLF